MMNALALGLVLTSLLTAGFFTPSPENQKSSKEDVIVKEGHRVVVVEFEKDDHHTKVLISPQDSEKLSEKNTEDAKEKTKESSLSSSSSEEEITHPIFRPRELICDAYGKCKHKIASAFEKTKETVAEKAHEAAGKIHGVEEEAKEAVDEAAGKVKDTVTHTAHQAFDKMTESKESVKDSAGEAKDKVVEKAHDVIDTTKEVKHEIEENASKKMEKAKENVENVKHGAHRVKREGEKELGEIMHRAREVGVDVFDYAFSSDRLASLSGVLHLMGFASAYGMCVWVTFASSYVLAEALPRHQFGMVQSKIYPVYFRSMAYSVGMAVLGHLMSRRISVGLFIGGFDLLAPLVMILVNLLYFEPRATKVMHERMKKEKEEGRGKEGHAPEPTGGAVDPTAERAGRGSGLSASAGDRGRQEIAKSELVGLSVKLQKLNSYSSFLNVLTLVSLTWHLVRLGQRLHMAC